MWGVLIGIPVQKEAFTQFAISALTMIGMLSILNIMLNEENIESNVSYREQTSWLYLIAMSLTFGPYLVWMAISPPGGPLGQPGADLSPLWLYAIACVIQLLILVGCVMPFTSGGWKIVNTAIFMIVIAQVVRDGLSTWSYRRGWHA